jgi:hypothetical protein
MSWCLVTIGLLVLALSPIAGHSSNGPLHRVYAFFCVLIAAVLLVGGAIVNAIVRTSRNTRTEEPDEEDAFDGPPRRL